MDVFTADPRVGCNNLPGCVFGSDRDHRNLHIPAMAANAGLVERGGRRSLSRADAADENDVDCCVSAVVRHLDGLDVPVLYRSPKGENQ